MKLRIRVEDRSYEVDVDILDAPSGNGGPHVNEASIPAPVLRPRPPHRMADDNVCRSPIAGRVSAVVAPIGRKVRRNELVVVIEAMKMEIPIGPAVDGCIKAIHVETGDSVKAGQVLFEIA